MKDVAKELLTPEQTAQLESMADQVGSALYVVRKQVELWLRQNDVSAVDVGVLSDALVDHVVSLSDTTGDGV